MPRVCNIWLWIVGGCFLLFSNTLAGDESAHNSYSVHPEYEKLKPKVIAVLPMINLSLEPEVENHLYNEVYKRLQSQGYIRISKETVADKMRELGIQTAAQIAAFSPQKLGNELKCDALLVGQIEQSASVHSGVYDAIVVSCSLALRSCSDGQVLWNCAQWRTAHRQWQLDPFNALINAIAHEKGSRTERISWLVYEMFKTLPKGPITVFDDNFLEKAIEIKNK